MEVKLSNFPKIDRVYDEEGRAHLVWDGKQITRFKASKLLGYRAESSIGNILLSSNYKKRIYARLYRMKCNLDDREPVYIFGDNIISRRELVHSYDVPYRIAHSVGRALERFAIEIDDIESGKYIEILKLKPKNSKTEECSTWDGLSSKSRADKLKDIKVGSWERKHLLGGK